MHVGRMIHLCDDGMILYTLRMLFIAVGAAARAGVQQGDKIIKVMCTTRVY